MNLKEKQMEKLNLIITNHLKLENELNQLVNDVSKLEYINYDIKEDLKKENFNFKLDLLCRHFNINITKENVETKEFLSNVEQEVVSKVLNFRSNLINNSERTKLNFDNTFFNPKNGLTFSLEFREVKDDYPYPEINVIVSNCDSVINILNTLGVERDNSRNIIEEMYSKNKPYANGCYGLNKGSKIEPFRLLIRGIMKTIN